MKLPYHRDNASRNNGVSNQKPYARYGFWASDKWVYIDTLNIIEIAIVLSYPLERGNKMLLLKALPIWVTRHRDITGINLEPSGVHNPRRVYGGYWGRKITNSLIKPWTRQATVTTGLARGAHSYAGGTITPRITDHLVIGFTALFTWQHPYSASLTE